MSTIFQQKAPGIMRQLMADFNLDVESAAAILGNLGHESGGFKFLQEKKPLVKGSAGGYGWAQWTGPRRRLYEAYCTRNGLDPASDDANYGWLFVELSGKDPKSDESKAIPAVKRAQGLAEKVEAFERNFERAGIKHYPSRLKYAQQALRAYAAQDGREIPEEDFLTNEEVKGIQENLRRLGYFSVGKIDGMWGTSTIGAIAQFQAHEGLPVTVGVKPMLDSKTMQQLVIAQPKIVAEERANTTVKDLRNQGSTVVRNADGINTAQLLMIGMAVIESIALAWQQYQAGAANLPFGSEMLMRMVGTPAWLLPVAQFLFALYSILKANKVIQARLDSERSGLHNGEPDPAPSPPTNYPPEPNEGLIKVNGSGKFGNGAISRWIGG